MDRRERGTDLPTAMLAALEGHQSGVWTALPAIVQSFNPAKQTVVVQPTIRARVQRKEGTFDWIELPLVQDCPVYFPKGGGVTLTFPVKAGDECLLVFASRCIDAWWQSGGIQNQADLRMHDLSDGFAFVGVSSVPAVISDISTTRAQFRSDDHDAFVEIDPTSHLIRLKTTGKITLDAGDDILIKSATKIRLESPHMEQDHTIDWLAAAPAIGFYGNMAWQGYGGGAGSVGINNMTFNYNNCTITYTAGTMTYNGKNLTDTHTHTGVQSGPSNTGGVT